MRRRWSPLSKLLAAVALACGLAAFVLVRGYTARIEALRPVVGSPVPVVVAAHDLTRGTQLLPSMVRLATMPSAFAPPGALADVDQVEGRTLISDMAEAEPVTRTRLASPGEGPVASLVPPGLRAFTVAAGVPAGSVRPGDLVDVLATFGGGRPHTETVASALEILLVLPGSAGDGGLPATTGSGGAGPSLVLLVSPDQSERLAYATAFAHLSVAIAPSEAATGQ